MDIHYFTLSKNDSRMHLSHTMEHIEAENLETACKEFGESRGLYLLGVKSVMHSMEVTYQSLADNKKVVYEVNVIKARVTS